MNQFFILISILLSVLSLINVITLLVLTIVALLLLVVLGVFIIVLLTAAMLGELNNVKGLVNMRAALYCH